MRLLPLSVVFASSSRCLLNGAPSIIPGASFIPSPFSLSSARPFTLKPRRPKRPPFRLAMSGGFDAASSGPDDVLRFWFGNEWFDDQERMKTPQYHKERNKVLAHRLCPTCRSTCCDSCEATDAKIRYAGRPGKLWFMSNDATDAEIRKSFMPLIRAAIAGELTAAEWSTHPGMIAQIVLLDQFTRNAFRGTAEAKVPHPPARIPRAISPPMRWPVASPVHRNTLRAVIRRRRTQRVTCAYSHRTRHSEILADHELLLRQGPLLGIADAQMQFARGHKHVIDRFGRYPHRNAQHKRESTPEELEWLASPDLPGWARSQLPK